MVKEDATASSKQEAVSVQTKELFVSKALETAGNSVCSICSVASGSMCQRCLSVVYCNKECQLRGWTGQNPHRKICAQIKKAKQKVEEETEKLRTFKRLKNIQVKKPKKKDFYVENLFKTSVGKFWKIKEAQPYCESRIELALALRECGALNKSNLAVELSLGHLFDVLKLTGGDLMKVIRSLVPSLLLYLEKEQEAYNFIKLWLTVKKYKSNIDWKFTSFLELKHEDLTEDLNWINLTSQEVVDICLAKIKAKLRLEKEIGFGVTLKNMDLKIQALFSHLKDVNELLWKFICDPEGMEQKCNQELGKNPMVFIDPKGDMKEALEVKRNVMFAWRNDINAQEFVNKYIGTKEALEDASMNSDWSLTLGIDQYSWLVDCYRLRVDDDYIFYGGCYLHGLYLEPSPENIARDFMVFCALAARCGLIPIIWDWNIFLKEASKNLNFPHNVADAEEDWGLLGPMMLRNAADLIYGGGPKIEKDRNNLYDTVQIEVNNANEGIFRDIGGVNNWFKFVTWLEEEQHKPNVTNFLMS